ncbi:MAG: hypothetical protein ACR2J8_02175 [Thermomicrobiales bacterium]
MNAPLAAATAGQDNASGPLDALMTVEAALVTLAGVVRDAGASGALAFDAPSLASLAAMQCEDEAHYHLLEALGAISAADRFAIPPGLLESRDAAIDGLLSLKEVALGGQMALARLIAAADPPDQAFAESLFSLGAVEGGHQVMLRTLRGETLPGGRAFLAWRFSDPRDVLDALSETGLLDAAEKPVLFPGPLPRDCRGVTGLVPETTEDAELWS